MRLSRFFVDQPLALGQHDLPETQAHYIGRVLRHATGDAVQLFDGSGREYLGELVEVGKKNVRVELREQFAGQPDSPLRIHLGQGLSRGERMDWAIQKATELGVAEITPIVSERCEVRLKDERADKRLQHWRQVAISACEQCGRSSLPLIHPPLALEDWLRGRDDDLRLVLHPVAAPPGQPCAAVAPGLPGGSRRRPERCRGRAGAGGRFPLRAPRPASAAHRDRAGGSVGGGPATLGRLRLISLPPLYNGDSQ